MVCTIGYIYQSQNAVDGPYCEANHSCEVDLIFWNELDNGLRGRLGLTNTKDKDTSWAS
jgi:hypothetical protein